MAGEGSVQGLRQVVKGLLEIGVDLEDLKDAMADVAKAATDVAQAAAPTRTGALRASIRGNRAKGKAVVTAGRARVPYAGAINYGWPARGIRGVGFMQKADEVVGPRAVQMLEDGINKIIQDKGFDS
ncbi:HK97 gp10 family phage protein [Nocardioides turkmenicus]|uniref:HK97 gp10 family phage protein n=1 Tax=Nocardioides turkmenicus TaxID=2711220 RepID=UPI0019D0FD41|nr:HK97 gp10 family phage protein [Nocardioides sp. KC13]